ncbi:RcnB family protein [Jinshanibacter sp. LJY008]|uniref:RcnB family protein n=1 Tax=Limnobaculum eriocheiris TaxID=2897391 RepID=A0A9X1MZF5_9GAMM|nr:anti-virulence regulator CigR family protein [Limnobaculum eriocheiris]MCD1127652.1 RcnB family protein [Limnobaculum eriocheiris]
MSKKLTVIILTALIPLVLGATPVNADPGGNGNENGQKQHDHKDKGNKGNQNKGNGHDDYDDVSVTITFNQARGMAVNYGIIGYKPLPPGIAKNLARGKPLPPGIAKKRVPVTMLNGLPHYPGYEWYTVGDDLVLVAVTTLIVNTILQGVFN